MTVPLLKATLIPIERRSGEQGEVTFSDPFIWSMLTREDKKRKEDAVMVFSRGDLLADLHVEKLCTRIIQKGETHASHPS